MNTEKTDEFTRMIKNISQIDNFEQLKRSLSHVLWIGGGTDAGKTSIADILAKRHNFNVYHYDKHDIEHDEILKERKIRPDLNMTMEEKWIKPTPLDLLKNCMQGFADRFPLMIEELLSMPKDTTIIAEGFGLTPELIHNLLSGPHKASFIFPTATFKYNSMERRSKLGVLKDKAPLGRRNLFIRDMLLSDLLLDQAKSLKLKYYITDGTKTLTEMTSILEKHFGLNNEL